MKKEKQGGGGRDPKFPVQATKNVMIRVQVGKEFPNMRQNERRIVYQSGRHCQNSRPAQGRTNPFHGVLASFYSPRTEKIPTGRLAFGDWLGCYKMGNRVSILPNIQGQVTAGLDSEAHGNCFYGAGSSRDFCSVTLVQDSTRMTLVQSSTRVIIYLFFLVGIFAISSSRDSISSIPEITTPTRKGGSYDTQEFCNKGQVEGTKTTVNKRKLGISSLRNLGLFYVWEDLGSMKSFL